MANFESLASAATSVERFLNACFQDGGPVSNGTTARASLVTTEDFETPGGLGARIPGFGISIFPFRIELNRVMRPAWSAAGSRSGRGHLPLDLHLLLTPWGSSPEYELRVLGRAMQCLEEMPILSGPLLDTSGGWEPADAVQVILGEISPEEIARTFDSLPHGYKLSVAYLLRVVRVDTAPQPPLEVSTAIARLRPSVTT
ncbi:MAG TPA: Pvc16 family protein [Longimicrobiaceae bacterium]|nr:Pvc16 family protein [Longimicrobiaceae bacterium]